MVNKQVSPRGGNSGAMSANLKRPGSGGGFRIAEEITGSKLTPGSSYGRKHASVQVHQGIKSLRSRPGSEHEAITSSLRTGLGR